ncbi:sec-independent protein translocase protein TatC [Knoellia remsis]|uniref:Sec-independent protein translocase protein TatC n=2 Tax=Knoellia remsis TaxID=407159 RepID=A0A2T0UA96_9MICO|nr:twin-arginine translocase subunit TatC [Knoellia remsis]PRY54846.1 sec-independent protein translocase protein TatC [Knoellia remsis]
MSLGDHLREFRRRVFVAAAAVVVGAVVAALNYGAIFDFLAEPFNDYKRANPQSDISLNFAEATAAFSNLITLSVFIGVLAASPVWLYQAWAFIVPGLTKKEKRVSLAFIAATVPLFLGGCLLGYVVLPQSLQLLYGFSPEGTSNIQQVSTYFSFVTRFILVFGAGFLFPVFLVAFNAVGILSASRMLAGWRVAVVAIFVFAAVATPTADPMTMFLLAIPLILLYFVAYAVARLIDRRREKARPDWLDVADDEASEL